MTIFNIRPPDDSICKVTLGAINSPLVGRGCGRGLGGGSASIVVAFFSSTILMSELLIATVLIKQINK